MAHERNLFAYATQLTIFAAIASASAYLSIRALDGGAIPTPTPNAEPAKKSALTEVNIGTLNNIYMPENLLHIKIGDENITEKVRHFEYLVAVLNGCDSLNRRQAFNDVNNYIESLRESPYFTRVTLGVQYLPGNKELNEPDRVRYFPYIDFFKLTPAPIEVQNENSAQDLNGIKGKERARSNDTGLGELG